MVYCNNEGCRFCAIDTELARGGVRVCTVDPIMIRVGTLKDWMLKCNNYKYRPIGEKLRPIVPIDFDGLYPGQIKPPVTWQEPIVLPTAEEEIKHVDENWLVRSTITATAGQEPECDT